MRDFSKIEQDIAFVLGLLAGKLSDQARNDVRESSERHGEYGLAVEDLIAAIEGEKIAVPPAAWVVLHGLVEMMSLDDVKDVLERLAPDRRS